MKKLFLVFLIVYFLSACTAMSRVNTWAKPVSKSASLMPVLVEAKYSYIDTSGANYSSAKSDVLGANAVLAMKTLFSERGYGFEVQNFNTQQKDMIKEKKRYLITSLDAKWSLEDYWEYRYAPALTLPLFKKYPAHSYSIGTQLASLTPSNVRYGVFLDIRGLDKSMGVHTTKALKTMTNILTLGLSDSLNQGSSEYKNEKFEVVYISIVDLKSGEIMYWGYSEASFDYNDVASIQRVISKALRDSSF